MIAEVDTALEALVRRDAVNGARVDIAFDAPTKDWVARRNAPTINLYLYDIREDLPRRQLAKEPVRDPVTGYVTERRMPARRFRLSYLVTAWTQRPEDEHRLLSGLLATFVRNEFIPFDLVDGSLADSPYPVLLTVCLPPPQDRSIADVWSAMGGDLKPSLDLIAVAPLDPNWTEEAARPILEEPLLGVGGPGIAAEGRAGGRGGLAAGHRGRVRRVGPLGPHDNALQEEVVRGGGLGAPRLMDEGGARAVDLETGGRGRATRTSKDDAGATGVRGVKGRGLDLAEAGAGRIARVRGIPRP